MQKNLLLLLTVLIPTSVFALPVGNPWDASLLCDGIFWEGECCTDFNDPCLNLCDTWNMRIGFYGDYVYDRHLRADTDENSSSIHRTEIYTNAAYIAFNFLDYVDLFGTLGATNLTFGGISREVGTETYFSWSIGARGTIWECGSLGVGAEAQYFSTRPIFNYIRGENNILQYGQSGDRLVYHEWQIGLGASYRYGIASYSTSLVPYIAVKWAGASMDSGDYQFTSEIGTFRLLKLKNDRSWGYAVGITLVGCSKVSVTAEGRFADERALHVNTQFRF